MLKTCIDKVKNAENEWLIEMLLHDFETFIDRQVFGNIEGLVPKGRMCVCIAYTCTYDFMALSPRIIRLGEQTLYI